MDKVIPITPLDNQSGCSYVELRRRVGRRQSHVTLLGGKVRSRTEAREVAEAMGEGRFQIVPFPQRGGGDDGGRAA